MATGAPTRTKSRDSLQWPAQSQKELRSYLIEIQKRDSGHFWTTKASLLKYWDEKHIVPRPPTDASSDLNANISNGQDDKGAAPGVSAVGHGEPNLNLITASHGPLSRKVVRDPSSSSAPSTPSTVSSPLQGARSRRLVKDTPKDLPTLTLPHSFAKRNASLDTTGELAKGPQTARGARRSYGFDEENLQRIRSRRRLSVGFNHSWDFNNIDITHDFDIAGIGNVQEYLRNKWDNESGVSTPTPSSRRTFYASETENAARLRQSVLTFQNRLSQYGSSSSYSPPSPSAAIPIPGSTTPPLPTSSNLSTTPPTSKPSSLPSKADRRKSMDNISSTVSSAKALVPDKPMVTFAKESSSDGGLSNLADTSTTKRSNPSPRTSSQQSLQRSNSGPSPRLDREISKGDKDGDEKPPSIKRSISSEVKVEKKFSDVALNKASEHKKLLESQGVASDKEVKEGVKDEFDSEGTLVLKRDVNEVGNYIIVAGTKDALVTALTTDKTSKSMAIFDGTIKEEEVDRDFTPLFLMTHASMAASTTSLELFKYLVTLYWGKDKKKSKSVVTLDAEVLKRRFLVVDIIHEWLEKYFYYFAEDSMHDLLKKFIKDIGKGSEEEKEWSAILKGTTALKLTEHQNRESLVFLARQVIGETAKLKGKHVKTRKPKRPRRAEDENKYGADGKNVSFIDIDYKVMAEQMVLLDCASLSSLQPHHLHGDISLHDDAPEVARVRKHSHNIAMWVAGEIVTTANIKQRTVVLTKFVELATYLYHLRDFEGFLNIFRGLTKPQVTRLAGTWRGLSPAILDPYENIKRKMESKGLGEFFDMTILAESPKIPPLSLLLDFMDRVRAVPETYAETSLVNFMKYRSIGHILLSLHTADWLGFFFDPIDPIQMFLQKHLTVISNEELSAASEKKHLTVISNEELSAASEKIQKRKANEKSAGTTEKTVVKKEPSIDKEKRKSLDKGSMKKAAVTLQERKITESRSETLKRIHGELVAKWERPLAQVSVHADVPRMVNKVLVINKKTGPPTIWPSSGEVSSSSLASIRGFFETLHRGMGHPELIRVPEFVSNLTSTSDSPDSDLQQNVSLYLGTLGENAAFVRLLKAACSQGIVAPVWTWLKMFLLSGHSFKDVKLGWAIYVAFEGSLIHVIHQKREQSNHDEEDPPRAPGEYDFEFTWELKMTFDLDMEKMASSSFGVSSFTTTKNCETSLAKKLEKKVKGWRMESFLLAEFLVLEKAKKSYATPVKPSTSTSFALSTYEEFRKVVQKESGPSSTPDKPLTVSDKYPSDRPRSAKKQSPREGHGSADLKFMDLRSGSVDEGTSSAVKRRSLRDINPLTSLSAAELPTIPDKDKDEKKEGEKDIRDLRKRPKSPSKTRKSLEGKTEGKQ